MKKLTYEEVKKYIESYGYKLVSTEYKGNDKKLITICPNGSVYDVSYNKFLMNRRCLCCRKKEMELGHKKMVNEIEGYEHVKSYFKGDKLPNGEIAKYGYLMVKHLYCGREYLIITVNFINVGRRCTHCCSEYENSFAHHIEVELGEPLEKYWDYEKNILNPYHIWKSGSTTSVWIKCQEKEYHGSYEIKCANFTNKNRCGYCNTNGDKIHKLDSFGYNHFDKVMSWHPDNDKSPFEVAANSHKKYKFICPKCNNTLHRSLANANKYGVVCKECSMSKGEKMIARHLEVNNIVYIYENEFITLLGVGGNNLSYDFYLKDYNLLIEFQGKQHEEFIPGLHESYDTFERQQEHDRRKRQYAKDNGIKLLEIWYYDFDNIENILKQQLKL